MQRGEASWFELILTAASRRARRAPLRRTFAAAMLDNAWWNTVGAFLNITWLASTWYIMSSFRCVTVSGKRVLAADPEQLCSGSSYAGILGIASFGMVFYAVGFPALCFGALLYMRRAALARSKGGSAVKRPGDDGPPRKGVWWRMRDNCRGFHDINSLAAFGWLYRDFKIRWWWFSVLHFVHRALFISFVTWVSIVPSIQILLSSIVTLAALLLYVYGAPFLLVRRPRGAEPC